MIIDVLEEMNESRGEKGQGSKSVKSRKSRVKIYPSIKDALNSAAPYGTIFSTKSADRLYVISKPTWGEKSRAGGNTRIAKGFTPGAATPSAAWPSIKSHAMRTSLKHGGTHRSSRLKKKYGPGKDRPEERRHTGKKKRRKDKPNESTQVDEAIPAALGLAARGAATTVGRIGAGVLRGLGKAFGPKAKEKAKDIAKEKAKDIAKEKAKEKIMQALRPQEPQEKTAKFERCVKKVKAKHGLREKLDYLAEVVSRKKKAERKAKIRALPSDERPPPSAPIGTKGAWTAVGPGKEKVAHRAVRRGVPGHKELRVGSKHFRGVPKGENPSR